MILMNARRCATPSCLRIESNVFAPAVGGRRRGRWVIPIRPRARDAPGASIAAAADTGTARGRSARPGGPRSDTRRHAQCSQSSWNGSSARDEGGSVGQSGASAASAAAARGSSEEPPGPAAAPGSARRSIRVGEARPAQKEAGQEAAPGGSSGAAERWPHVRGGSRPGVAGPGMCGAGRPGGGGRRRRASKPA